MSHLHSIAYLSRSAITAEGAPLGIEVGSILNSAHKNNIRHRVTGALLYSGGWFAQVLEGNLTDVELILENIMCDKRHNGVTIVHNHPITERSFAAWSMAFAGINDISSSLASNGLLHSPKKIETGVNGRGYVDVLYDLCRRNEWPNHLKQ
jgi:hypothetical protein